MVTCGLRDGQFAIIVEGTVRLERAGKEFQRIGPGEYLGEMALIDNEPRSASATALTDVELVPVSEKQFLFLVSQTPNFALKVMRTLARRLRTMNKVVD